MKKHYSTFCVLALCALLSSCGTTYKYVQICTAEPVANATAAQKTETGLVYENNDCKISYYFWGSGGDAGFVFYNKTDQVIHVDLSQTFLKKNSAVYDYYIPSTVTKTTSSGVISTATTTKEERYNASSSVSLGANKSVELSVGAMFFGSQTNTNASHFGRSESVSTENQAVISIPPKAYRMMSLYAIQEQPFYDCELNNYPEQSAHLTYSAENSPLTFSNYITYRVGDSENKQAIENKFYISEVANYAIPYITSFAPHEKTCDNLLTPAEQKKQKSAPKLYDAYLNVDGTDKYYINYSVFSKRRLYETPDDFWLYIWSNTYQAYTHNAAYANYYLINRSNVK